jgi:predicted short-subunit dehydrogenase-like oxidoreductase (DUF2520 family)
MIKVVLLGYGNVGHHLFEVMNKTSGIEVVQVYNHKLQSIQLLTPFTSITDKLEALVDADLYLIAVSDKKVSGLSRKIPLQGKLVAHTSGSVSMHQLDKKNRRAVFYPLQSFSKQRKLNFGEIPICIESEAAEDLKILKKVATALGSTTHKINTDQRRSLHLSAVFINNFTNHLYRIGHELCEENVVDFNLLKPLIKETAAKLEDITPYNAQTGPARRGDLKTIEKQENQLQSENHKAIYKLLTQSIQKLYGSKKL